MRISQVIERLQAVQDAEGDIAVGLIVGEHDDIEEADRIEVRPGERYPGVEAAKMAFLLP